MSAQVSVIATVLNEEKTIGAFLDALLAQSRSPDEIIIADGGSTDHTAEIVRRYSECAVPVRLLLTPGNRSVGRNAAVRAARHSVIACSDAGCVPDRKWLEHIVKPFEEDANTTVVSGFIEATTRTQFQACTKALMLSTREEIDPQTWLPSSRSVAFTKEAWAAVGGYPECFSLNEDTPFDKKLLAQGYVFHFAPDAVVYWEPRSNLAGFAQQFFAYARGDGQGWLDAKAYIRCGIRIGLAVFLLALGILVPLLLIPLLILVALYLTRRCFKVYRRLGSIPAFLLAWILTMTYDVVTEVGFWYGVTERILNPSFRSC